MVALPTCGRIKQLGNEYNLCDGGKGSGVVTSKPTAPIKFPSRARTVLKEM